jgi:hypothetical protein
MGGYTMSKRNCLHVLWPVCLQSHVRCVQGSKTAPNIVGEWKAAKESTEQTMKLMQMYKDLGDFEGQVRSSSSSDSRPGEGVLR